MSKKFETFFEGPYNEIKKVLKKKIKDNQKIIDLGCSNGNLEDAIDEIAVNCEIYCIDIDKKALSELESKNLKNKVHIINSDANEFLQNTPLKNIDVILVNATLHEINDPKNQREYLNDWFSRLKKILKENGQIIIGDYYYADSVSDEELEQYKKQQLKEIGHADDREKFAKPNLIKKVAKENNINITYENEILAVKGIDRRYYIYICQV